jgi:hypothetical protein
MDRLGSWASTRAIDLPFTGYDDDVAAAAACRGLWPGAAVIVCHSYAGLAWRPAVMAPPT